MPGSVVGAEPMAVPKGGKGSAGGNDPPSLGGAAGGAGGAGGDSCAEGPELDPACQPVIDCPPGERLLEFIDAPGEPECVPCMAGTYSSEHHAVDCLVCPPGTFAAAAGAAKCEPWSICQDPTFTSVLGSPWSDQVCGALLSLQQTNAMAADGDGNVYAAMKDSRIQARAFVPGGTQLWESFVSVGQNAESNAIAVDDSRNAYVAGFAYPTVAQEGEDSRDAVIVKLTAAGTEAWLQRFQAGTLESAQALAPSDDGSLYVTGSVVGALPGQISSGGGDAFLRKYDAAGLELWTTQLGSAEFDFATAVTVDAVGGVYVAGIADPMSSWPWGAKFGNAFLRKCNSDGAELWGAQLNTDYDVSVDAVRADALGNVYVAGTHASTKAAFLNKYDADGAALWTKALDTQRAGGFVTTAALAVDEMGDVYLAGDADSVVAPTLSSGAYVRKYTADGVESWTRTFGPTNGTQTRGITLGKEHLYVVGTAYGSPSSSFLVSLDR